MAKVFPEVVTFKPERSRDQFFVVCSTGKPEMWRRPGHSGIRSIEEVLESPEVFVYRTHVKSEPERPTLAELENGFGMTDKAAIAALIVERGTGQQQDFGGEKRANLNKSKLRTSSSDVHQ